VISKHTQVNRDIAEIIRHAAHQASWSRAILATGSNQARDQPIAITKMYVLISSVN